MVEHFFVGADRPWHFEAVPKPLVTVNSAMGRRLNLRVKILSWTDSGAFQIVRKHGHYPYDVHWYREQLEAMGPSFFTQMDWPCENDILRRTGLTVQEHQTRSTASAEVCARFELGDSTFVPTIQGWAVADYLRHAEDLERRGLWAPYMAVGSVCRRGSTRAVETVLIALRDFSPTTRYHGFGVKTVDRLLRHLWSADSFAWRYGAWMKHLQLHGPHSKDSNSRAWLEPFLRRYVEKTKRWEARGVASHRQGTLRARALEGAATR